MRIITGTARGYRLETLSGDGTRPTAERVKEGVFSALQFDIEGRQVLDLFAGSGQMGLEALSRGAAGCVFVDKNPEAAAIIRRNISGMAKRDNNTQKNAQVMNTDALAYLKKSNDMFDIVFIDPPYSSNLHAVALEAVEPHMNAGGVIICETENDTQLSENVGGFGLSRVYNYGRVRIWLYRFKGDQNEGVCV
ncbi:MAG: 16S rRNA (guanine(966)-N(2))-methyltransferase RsmD [Oscillospiraceae bacterium]|nr:16S rRNA (guanine(966)-N(2))-methyltransferase RsmD [Oscillospiraceae bacterium]MDD4414880.1 16S rRNA (guanine(966)-N(2))-methyltransferase RsmD [Oscillospiraceae bacterium]